MKKHMKMNGPGNLFCQRGNLESSVNPAKNIPFTPKIPPYSKNCNAYL